MSNPLSSPDDLGYVSISSSVFFHFPNVTSYSRYSEGHDDRSFTSRIAKFVSAIGKVGESFEWSHILHDLLVTLDCVAFILP